MIKRTVFFLALVAMWQSVFAYDFSAVGPSGQTLYYNIVNGEAQVTYETTIWPAYFDLVGTLTIPGSVTDGGTTYTVTSIGNGAFSGCSGLTSVAIPNSVTSIGADAFFRCSGLTSIIVDDGNSVYDSRDNCNAIIKTATNTLFIGCKSTIIPSSVTSIDSWAFAYSDLSSITIPSSVTSIGSSAFIGCSGLSSITVDNGNTVYDSRDNCNAVIETATNTLVAGCQTTAIPSSVTSIGDYAFSDCSGLTSVTIPDAVTSIGDAAFYGCSGLTSVTIPGAVTSIRYQAFMYCRSLADVTCLAATPPLLGQSAFFAIQNPCTLTMPCGSEEAYRASSWGGCFTNIQCMEVGIEEVAEKGSPIRVWGAQGRIFVEGAEGREVSVYDMMGRRVAAEGAGRDACLPLRAGVYLVRVEGLAARKVVVL